jgi:hypothetical protein
MICEWCSRAGWQRVASRRHRQVYKHVIGEVHMATCRGRKTVWIFRYVIRDIRGHEYHMEAETDCRK